MRKNIHRTVIFWASSSCSVFTAKDNQRVDAGRLIDGSTSSRNSNDDKDLDKSQKLTFVKEKIMKEFPQKFSMFGLMILLTACGAQQAPQKSGTTAPAKSSPAADSKVSDVKAPDSSLQPNTQPINAPAVPQQIIPQQLVPQQIISQQTAQPCKSNAGTGVIVGGVLQTINGFVTGNFMQGTGGVINIIGGAQMNKC